jgi:hypothetical protein
LIRLIIPDLELLARNYIKEIEDIQNNREKWDYLPSERFLDGLGMGEKAKTSFVFVITKLYSKHKWMYDQLSLTALLKSCGFVDIHERSYKEGECPDIDFLDNRPEESLFVETRKP